MSTLTHIELNTHDNLCFQGVTRLNIHVTCNLDRKYIFGAFIKTCAYKLVLDFSINAWFF